MSISLIEWRLLDEDDEDGDREGAFVFEDKLPEIQFAFEKKISFIP